MPTRRRPGITLATALLALAALALPARGARLRPAATPIYSGTEGTPLAGPAAVACRGSVLLIADSGNSRLLRYDLREKDIVASAVWTVPELPYPIRVQIDSKGGIWVLDGKLRRIARLSSSGEFLSYLEPKGESGQALVPRSFRIAPNGDLYILDVGAARILVLSPEGAARRTIAFPEGVSYLSDLAVDSTGTVFAVDSVGRRVFVAKGEDELLGLLSPDLAEHLDFPTAIAVDVGGRLFLADQNGGGIVILNRDGSFRSRQGAYGWKPGMLRYPTDLCAGDDRLFVADMGNSRVQVYEILE